MARVKPILAYRECKGRPRSERAVEGALLGAAVGVVAGAIMGGMVLATGSSKRDALIVSLGIFGVATIGQAGAAAWAPEC